jgi:hypothetical protein
VKAPFEKLATAMHRRYYDKFDEIWVPDVEGDRNLSGELGHGGLDGVRYIGPLTRFEDPTPWHTREPRWWLVVLLSGPEPQRSVFENVIIGELAKFTEETLVVRGLPGDTELPSHALPHVTFVNHLDDAQLREALLSSHNILCRPGYSTLCDLSALKLSPVVVPTPGQPEQEYLAAYHANRHSVVSCAQKNFNLGEAIRRRTQLKPFGVFPQPHVLSDRVSRLLKK